jgi:hypothetical protein
MPGVTFKISFALASVLMMAAFVPPAARAETVSVIVPGQASPYLAGMPNGSTCCQDAQPPDDTAPAQSPVQVHGIPLVPGTVLVFSAQGGVGNCVFPNPGEECSDPGESDLFPPDGSVFQNSPFTGLPGTDDDNGIARINAPLNSLVGVFLDDREPITWPTPSGLDFADGALGRSFATLCPGLKQPFFIGDGGTGQGSGALQRFVVPFGATRFFLGTVDGYDWNTNGGAFNVTVTSIAPMTFDVNVNSGQFAVGQTLSASVSINSPARPGAVADLFLGFILPDGQTVHFLTAGGIVPGNVFNPGSFRAIVPNLPLDQPFAVDVPNLYSQQWTGAEQRGNYVFFLLALPAGAIGSGLACNEVLGIDAASYTFQ